MNEIKKITDMKIKLSNGNVIYCYKSILKNIPYFKILLEDVPGDDLYVDF